MGKIDNFASELNENNKSVVNKLRTHIFDVIALGLVVSIGLLNLGAIELKNIGTEIFSILLEAVPFYLGSVALALNYYKKGVYAGKATKSFLEVVNAYSQIVNGFVGKQIDKLNEFCSNYNRKALLIKQESILREAAISIKRFDEYTEDECGNILPPLKIVSDDDLIATYGEYVGGKIIQAKNVKIKGISPNSILGNNNTDDITDLGKTEQEMFVDRSKEYSILYSVSIVVMSVMGVKDILEWGWMGAFLLLFKLLYILSRSYMKYFEGFDDVTIRLVNHMSRKIDVLKEFDYWYGEEIETKEVVKLDVESL